MNSYAPVAIYTYSRLDHLRRTIESLINNTYAEKTVLYIVSDGPAIPEHKNQVQTLRDYIDEITGFREVIRIYRPKNIGALASITQAESQIINDHGSIISLEDDNICSENFLAFMNEGLNFFEYSDTVFTICGYVPDCISCDSADNSDFWFYPWNLSWGYATHKKKYNLIHPLVNKYPEHKKSGILSKQNSVGGLYVTDSLLRDYKKQKRLTDAILCTEMFARGMVSVLPVISKVLNIGQDGSGQSTSTATDKYITTIDSSLKTKFDFSNESIHAQKYNQQMIRFQNGSFGTRITRQLGIYHAAERIVSKLKNARIL